MSGDSVTRTLNDVFGFDGWSLEVKKSERQDFTKDGKGRYHVAYISTVRVTHRRSGAFKEDCGAGDSIDKSLGTATSHALKASVTDALKRAVRHFGDKLGNSLYESSFSLSKAPNTLKDAIIQYDIDRAKTKFGFEKKKQPNGSPNGGSVKTESQTKYSQHQHQMHRQTPGKPNGGSVKTESQRTYPQHQQHQMQKQNNMNMNRSGPSPKAPIDPPKPSNIKITPLSGDNAPLMKPKLVGNSVSKGLTRFQNVQHQRIQHQQPPSINATYQPSPPTSSNRQLPLKESNFVPSSSPNNLQNSTYMPQNRKEVFEQEQKSKACPLRDNSAPQHLNVQKVPVRSTSQRDQVEAPMYSSTSNPQYIQAAKENSIMQSSAYFQQSSGVVTKHIRIPLVQKNAPTEISNLPTVGQAYKQSIAIDPVSKVIDPSRPSTSRGHVGSVGSGYQNNQGQQVASSSNTMNPQHTGKRLHQNGESNGNKRRSLNPYK
jgi:DNA recombination protein Rad52